MPRALLFHGPGLPLEPVRLPLPDPVGAEIRVRVVACSLCRSDLHTHAGRRSEPAPLVLGHEIAGRIEAFGPEAARSDAAGRPAEVGDRVTWALVAACGNCFFCARDLPQKCERGLKYGHRRFTPEAPFFGGLADVVVLAPGTAWFRVPDAVPDEVAAMANCAVATAAACIRGAAPGPGDTVLVLGAGVLGLSASAMLSAAGVRVVVGEPDAERRALALRFGAALAAPPEDLPASVRDRTGGRGADAVLELAGAAGSAEAALELARTGGTVILAGTVSRTPPVALDPEQVVRRMLTLRGAHNYHPRDLGRALEFLGGPGAGFPFPWLAGAAYELEEAEAAFRHAHGSPGARVLVKPSGDEQPGRPEGSRGAARPGGPAT